MSQLLGGIMTVIHFDPYMADDSDYPEKTMCGVRPIEEYKY